MQKALMIGLVALLALAAPTGVEADPYAPDEEKSERGSCITLAPSRVPPVFIDPPSCLPQRDP